MKKLFCLVAIVFNLAIAKAELSNIVALVNNEPITLHEFLARKHMIMALNNINNPDSQTDKQLDKMAINSVIDDLLLYQSVNGKKSSDSELNESIETIEQRNKMAKGQLMQLLKSKSVDINSFKSQIGAEIIKMNILSSISRSVAISAKEVDAIILATNSKDAEVSAQIFTSKDKQDKTLQKMYGLQKRLTNCHDIKESLYKDFSTLEIVNQNLSTLDSTLQTILKDLNTGEKSSVFEMQDGFKLILMCNKKIVNITLDENNYVVNLLTNKKMSQKAQKYFEDMRKKAYIKIMLPL
ncbi:MULTISPECIES: SurA N-terminal domain-containing protein [unclassified Candidatus Tisiphia]|uniref:SurA N-terminal domain-containing protein n=1 Tax=unclassified Candidatus Tisiphia TaxID=2996318 RepID=UPI00312CA3CF|nr:SurA N-terminal domain-containing protein [Rickettsiaceae bacterium]MDD9337094.1 SurA N-terminal domain-containing protein [Rickettsiaceae bacterium]